MGFNASFATEQLFEEAIKTVAEEANLIELNFKNKITDAKKVLLVLAAYKNLNEKMIPIGTYASLAYSVDQTDDAAQMRSAKVGQVFAKINADLSFITSELLQLEEAILIEAKNLSPDFAHYIEKLIRKKSYLLHPDAEKALAAFGATFDAPYELYNTTKLVDIQFEQFEVNGKTYPLSYNLFEGDWELESDTEIRRAAFEAFSTKLRQYQHTTAKTYDMHLKIEKTESDLRGYKSIFDFLLFNQEVDRELYNRQIDLITAN